MSFYKMIKCAALLSVVACSSSFAQTDPPAAPDAPATTTLPEVVVEAKNVPVGVLERTPPATTLADTQLRKASCSTLGETLGQQPGVSSTAYGPNASRPILRGLDGDRIGLLQNGLGTMDVSSASPDHAVSQDPLTLKSIQVLRGPAALLYNGSTIGGVVNTIDNRIPETPINAALTGTFETRFGSADLSRGGAGVVEGGAKGWNYHFDGFARASDALSIPGFARSSRLRALDPLPLGEMEARNRLPNSQGSSQGGAAGFSYTWDKGYAGAAFQGYDSDYGTVAEEDVTIRLHQRRGDVAGALQDPASAIKALRWKFGYSHYDHTEFEGPEPGTLFEQDALNARLELEHKPLGPLEGVLGYAARHEALSVTGDEAFLPRTDTLANALFLLEELKAGPLTFQAAGRLEQTNLQAADDPVFGPMQSRAFLSPSGSIGATYRPTPDYAITLTLSSNGRAPNNQELFANGPHLATGIFEAGDSSLQTERSRELELGFRKEVGRVTGAASFFYTRYDNFIAQTPRGATDPVSGLPIYDFRSIPAEFFGAEAAVTFHLLESDLHKIHFTLKSDCVFAANTRTDEPLPRIPPWRIGGELEYSWKDRLTANLALLHAHAQHEVAQSELPTDGYFLLDLSLSYRIASGPINWDLLIKGTNLLDEEIRLHTSFLKDIAPLAGRGAIIAVRASF